jgi:hypothetical protein
MANRLIDIPIRQGARRREGLATEPHTQRDDSGRPRSRPTEVLAHHPAPERALSVLDCQVTTDMGVAPLPGPFGQRGADRFGEAKPC